MDVNNGFLDNELCTQLSKHVTDLTSSGDNKLDPTIMKKVKIICRKSNGYVERVYSLVSTQLQREHSQIRYSCLLIIDELFRRSHHFRNLLLSDFQDFLELTVETDPELQLPPPKAAAKNLKNQGLRFVQEWYNQFKDGYKLLVLGYNFLKECKAVKFDEVEAISIAQRQVADEANRRKELLLKEKESKTLAEMNENIPEITTVLNQLENALKLVLPHPDEFFLPGDFVNHSVQESLRDESNLSQDEISRLHGFGKRGSYNIQVEVDHCLKPEVIISDESVWENMRDLYTQASKTFQPLILSWLKSLTKVGNQDRIKEIIDLKGRLENSMAKCVDLKINSLHRTNTTLNESDCSDEDFEEVAEKEGYEPVIPSNLRSEYGLEASIAGPSTSKGFCQSDSDWTINPNSKEDILDPTTRLANMFYLNRKLTKSESSRDKCLEQKERNIKLENDGTKLLPQHDKNVDGEEKESCTTRKSKLLSKAPRKNYDIDLYHWEEEKLQAPEIVKFDSLHKFWTPRENDSHLREMEDVASLRQRVIDFTGEFQPIKWSCRAPLPSGKLCPRKDKVKCPFHGAIVARDEMGKPTKENNKQVPDVIEIDQNKTDTPDWQDPELLRDIQAATGVDLQMPQKGKRKKLSVKNETKLANLKNIEMSTRKRLEKKVLNKGSVKRVSDELDIQDFKRLKDKFGNQWNYSFNS